jgi:S-adenosylmethionine:diacylglycerol 3-amino-3-carboxypropyl transferase
MDVNQITGEEKTVRDEQGRFLKGVSGNPNGSPSVKRMTAQSFIDAFRTTLGEDYPEAITKLVVEQAQKGNSSLLCKILDKILPSKTENKNEITATYREEFAKMHQKAVELLKSRGARYN